MEEDWDQWIERLVKSARPDPRDSRVTLFDAILSLEDLVLYSLWCQESELLLEEIVGPR